jgi:hypothetical protein
MPIAGADEETKLSLRFPHELRFVIGYRVARQEEVSRNWLLR